ncbi:AMMECR1 domain-containing protein [Pseudoneurospora amorphoporcata]|uniref:AMMECR1 domain-containing protein n=1 Tax=Pseudoneurospora amorphoporcata TaxID=241081 RepID=A0AAN6SHC3_9PEZI|nr:AMMECR1 domain-containing protein [Pseudoneurospora amorphoporcata]
MATVEHCLCCFEALAAYHERRKPMSLSEIEKSWAEYINTIDDEDPDNKEATTVSSSKAPQIPALRRLAAAALPSSSTSSSSTSLATSSSTSTSSSNTTFQSGISTPATSITSSISPAPPTQSPLFVTWNVVHDSDDDVSLRGCIGTFESQPLSSGLPSYALTSALQDTRFHPISWAELPSLQVAVTLLTDFEPAADAMDWELGKHGLRISFVYRGRRYGATYLPDVAPEQGWTKEETVVSLMRKAGWEGNKSRWREVELRVVRYQGKKEKLGYEEYKAWRDWVDGKRGE